jgi:hypothetical protein
MAWLPHVVGLVEGLGLPNTPLVNVQPVLGEIDQLVIDVESHVPLLYTTTPLVDVLVKVTGVLMQLTVSGLIEKSASGGVIVV